MNGRVIFGRIPSGCVFGQWFFSVIKIREADTPRLQTKTLALDDVDRDPHYYGEENYAIYRNYYRILLNILHGVESSTMMAAALELIK